ncbi:MAG: hypothetical protein RMM17_13570 [Acidobacteriota bacterium]|nr:hypothetical protein [Blastocatellia bacterium]MDW8413697.1 hypothetical protein [Acidobacteriota bacterium]
MEVRALVLVFCSIIITVDAQDKKTTKSQPVRQQKRSSVPSLQERLEAHRLAIKRGEEREPSSVYLIDELTVTGVYKSVEGYGAFLRAVNNRTFFAYTGMQFYDGVVTAITPEMVVFEQNAGGKKKKVVKIYDPNALRQEAQRKAEEAQKSERSQQKDDDE